MLHRSFATLPILLLVACGHEKDPHAADPRVPVVVTQPSRTQEFEQVSVSGTLTSPGNPSMVAFLVPGRAVKVLHREGEPVRKGELLAELDSENLGHASSKRTFHSIRVRS